MYRHLYYGVSMIKWSSIAAYLACSILLTVLALPLAHSANAPTGYAVRDAKVSYMGKELPDITVNMLPPAVSQVRSWVVIEEDDVNAGGEKGAGAHFFDKDGKAIFHLPISPKDCQEVFPNEDGQWLLLLGGSPGRNDKSVTLYKLFDVEPKAAFDMHAANSPLWVDVDRFILTRLDGMIRDNDGAYVPFDSVLLYDAKALKQVVLKPSDATHSYVASELSADKKKAKITESWVKKAEDWASSENNVQSREYWFELPAAR